MSAKNTDPFGLSVPGSRTESSPTPPTVPSSSVVFKPSVGKPEAKTIAFSAPPSTKFAVVSAADKHSAASCPGDKQIPSQPNAAMTAPSILKEFTDDNIKPRTPTPPSQKPVPVPPASAPSPFLDRIIAPFKNLRSESSSSTVAQKTAGESAFVDELFTKVRPLLDVIDKLRDVGCEKLIQLPRIAVVGEQSTGKSSVLESLVGEDFLPKHNELATRVPLWLRMIRDPFSTGLRAFVGAAPDSKQAVLVSDLTAAISYYTDQIAGTSKNIVNKPIYVDVFAPDCPDLTLVDLPGIAKNPIHGSDQPDNIEDITKDLIAEFIKDSETVILAVVPANMDVAASDAIKIARRYDPQGDRTVGVLTKVDIMDSGTNASRILLGEYVKLKLGFVAVKNRSQKELNDGVTVRQALRDEMTFFSTHPAYKDMNPSLFGCKNLSKKLMHILASRIDALLPTLREKVTDSLESVEAQVHRLGDAVSPEEADQRRLVTRLLKEYSDSISSLLDGLLDDNSLSLLDSEQDFGPAVISKIFQDFAEAIAALEISKLLSDDEIRRQLRNTQGTALPNFLSFRTFKFLIRPPIEKMSRPSSDCLDRTHRYLQDLCFKLAKHIFGRFPLLLDRVRNLSDGLLASLRSDCKERLSALIEHQRYVYTSNPEYLRLTRQPTAHRTGTDGVLQQEQVLDEVQELRRRLSAYYALVKSVISDEVTRTIGYSFQNGLQCRLFLELESSIGGPEAGRLLAESPEKVELRKRLLAERDILQQSMNVLARSSEQLSF